MMAAVKKGLAIATHTAAFAQFVNLVARWNDRRPNLLRVLTYHRVAEPDARPDLSPRLISATPSQFEQQMSYLAAHWRVVSMDEVLEAVDHGQPLPPKAVLLTFDDAYQDFAEHAWPILKRHRLPVTLFVPTAYPDQPQRSFWWDRLYQALHHAEDHQQVETPLGPLPLRSSAERMQSLRQLLGYVKTLSHEEALEVVERIGRRLDAPPPSNSVLGWDALRQLAAEGVTLAPHTRTHPLMNRVTLDQARAEAVGSWEDLRQQIGPVPPVFAYPAGALSNPVAEMLQREGFRLAFSTCRGLNDLAAADRLRLRRINLGYRTADALWRAQLLAGTFYFNRWLAGT